MLKKDVIAKFVPADDNGTQKSLVDSTYSHIKKDFVRTRDFLTVFSCITPLHGPGLFGVPGGDGVAINMDDGTATVVTFVVSSSGEVRRHTDVFEVPTLKNARQPMTDDIMRDWGKDPAVGRPKFYEFVRSCLEICCDLWNVGHYQGAIAYLDDVLTLLGRTERLTTMEGPEAAQLGLQLQPVIGPRADLDGVVTRFKHDKDFVRDTQVVLEVIARKNYADAISRVNRLIFLAEMTGIDQWRIEQLQALRDDLGKAMVKSI
jgi:hypothetical protein